MKFLNTQKAINTYAIVSTLLFMLLIMGLSSSCSVKVESESQRLLSSAKIGDCIVGNDTDIGEYIGWIALKQDTYLKVQIIPKYQLTPPTEDTIYQSYIVYTLNIMTDNESIGVEKIIKREEKACKAIYDLMPSR